MKNTLIALLLVGSSSALFAQNTQNPTNNTNTNTTTNSSTTTEMNSTNNNTTSPTTTPDASTNTNTDVRTNTNTTTADPNTSNPNPNANTSPTTDMNTTTDNSTSSSVSSSSYNAYGTVAVDVPSTVRYSFQKDYPTVTNAQWYQTPNGQLRVMYKDANNQDMDVYYYGNSAQSYMVSLPVMQSFTSEDIAAKARSMFGLNVYDINRVKAANSEYVYHLRLLDNGQVKSVWLSEQGTEVAATDVFRTADANADVIQETNTTTNSATTTDPSAIKSNTTTDGTTNKEMNNAANSENTNSKTTESPATSTETK